jgi:putative aldouronate transport system permease protein
MNKDLSLKSIRGTKPNKKTSFMKTLNKYKYLYIMLVPVVIWYIIFCYQPMYGVITAFQDYNMNKGNFGSPFVGLKHFNILIKDTDFWIAFKNTFTIAIYRMVIEFPIPIIIAILLNEVRSLRFKKAVQTIIYLPHFLSWVIVASILLVVFNPERGLVPIIYNNLGMTYNDVLTDPEKFRSILVWSDVWKESGWSTIIYVAAMGGINVDLYESAAVDGANRWQKIIYITLPGIKNVIVVMLILMAGQVLNWGFDQVYNLYNPMVYSSGDIVSTYIFRTALGDMKLSYAAAAGLFNSIICIILLVSTNKIAKMINDEGIY